MLQDLLRLLPRFAHGSRLGLGIILIKSNLGMKLYLPRFRTLSTFVGKRPIMSAHVHKYNQYIRRPLHYFPYTTASKMGILLLSP